MLPNYLPEVLHDDQLILVRLILMGRGGAHISHICSLMSPNSMSEQCPLSQSQGL
jgi:hypothetical protein